MWSTEKHFGCEVTLHLLLAPMLRNNRIPPFMHPSRAQRRLCLHLSFVSHATILTLDGTSDQSRFSYPSTASSPQAKS